MLPGPRRHLGQQHRIARRLPACGPDHTGTLSRCQFRQPRLHRERPVPGYEVEIVTHRIGGNNFRIRALLNRQQFSDPDGTAEHAGVSPAEGRSS